MRAAVVLCLLCACQTDRTRPPTVGSDPFDAGPEPEGGSSDAATPEDPGPPLREGDLVFVLPFEGAPQQAELAFEADVRQLDVHFSIDTTFSFDQEIDELQSQLIDQVIPGIRARVADATVGVSRFEDFPLPPFGGPDDRPFRLEQRQTTFEGLAARAVARLDSPLGRGGDLPESSLEALYQIATGEGFDLDGARIVDRFDHESSGGGGSLGGVGFREGALPVVVQVTDAEPHTPSDYRGSVLGTHARADAVEALQLLGARVIGIASGPEARPNLLAIASETRALVPPDPDGTCRTGIDGAPHTPDADGQCPLVFDIDDDGAGLSATIVTAITDLLSAIVFDSVSIEILGDDLGFVVEAAPLDAEGPPGSLTPELADLLPEGGDGRLDSFVSVPPATRLRFRIVLANTRIRSTDYEQIFFLRARLIADGRTVVDDKLIEIRIP